MQYYIVAQPIGMRSSPSYFCSSPTQGERILPFAYSMAKRFDNKGDALSKVKQLEIEYRGLKFSVKKATQ